MSPAAVLNLPAVVLPLFACLSRPILASKPSFPARSAATCSATPPPARVTMPNKKKILITGATDGIGLEAAKLLAAAGHDVLLHGRSARKMRAAVSAVASAAATAPASSSSASTPDSFLADLSDLASVDALAAAVLARHPALDVLVNNAGVLLRSPAPATNPAHLDVHFVVNALAPYRLVRLLRGALAGPGARVVNLSSAAQTPVRLDRLTGDADSMSGFDAYGMSKLAITMWSRALADETAREKGGGTNRVVVAVNPGSYLGTKMVKETLGMSGNDIMIGARILERAAVGDDFADANGKYFDNDARAFAEPHRDARDPAKNARLVQELDNLIAQAGGK